MTADKRLIGVKRQVETSNNILVDRRCGWDSCGKSAAEVKLQECCRVFQVVGLEREREKSRAVGDEEQQILHKWKTLAKPSR
jgi:hypothetical protein